MSRGVTREERMGNLKLREDHGKTKDHGMFLFYRTLLVPDSRSSRWRLYTHWEVFIKEGTLGIRVETTYPQYRPEITVTFLCTPFIKNLEFPGMFTYLTKTGNKDWTSDWFSMSSPVDLKDKIEINLLLFKPGVQFFRVRRPIVHQLNGTWPGFPSRLSSEVIHGLKPSPWYWNLVEIRVLNDGPSSFRKSGTPDFSKFHRHIDSPSLLHETTVCPEPTQRETVNGRHTQRQKRSFFILSDESNTFHGYVHFVHRIIRTLTNQ